MSVETMKTTLKSWDVFGYSWFLDKFWPTVAQTGVGDPSEAELVENARRMQQLYDPKFRYPDWSIEMLERGQLSENMRRTVVYHLTSDDIALVQEVAREREPCNIAMCRHYNEQGLEAAFGYRRGAYGKSTSTRLMPNIAIFCRTPIRAPMGGDQVNINVINLIGYAFDSGEQPDSRYFFENSTIPPEKWQELVDRMSQMWRFAFECGRRHGLTSLFITNVGGGAFSTLLNNNRATCYDKLKAESLPRVRDLYPDIQVHPLPRIPHWAFTAEARRQLDNSLLVNAWDPWSMVGNGNAADNSLDGFFGRSTAMALLCWPHTNPHMRYEGIASVR
eukprot:NODE_9251_length_1436_cov_14.540871.p1 GENE.NODE_9251_length_1436_cov_14.540871~~NODE_9251_length_1436_cov_14.540871.p1  ORF type:complete len:365 (+),score=58.40 NODE_9251_length_1436_cov_14.540871:97-1095(+)